MSLVLAGRRRVCVLVFFHERPGEGLATVRLPLSQVERALDGGFSVDVGTTERRDARLVLSARLHRRWGRSVFGLSFFVVALDATEPRVPATARNGGRVHEEISRPLDAGS